MQSISGTFTLTLEEDGHLANLELSAPDPEHILEAWAYTVYCVESKLTGASIRSGRGTSGTLLLIRTPK